MFFGINDISTSTIYETAYIAYIAIFSAIVNANIFGTITVLIQDMNRKSEKFEEEVDTAMTAMNNLGIPNNVSRVVKDYLIFTEYTKDLPEEL
jgi:hypothetical protein